MWSWLSPIEWQRKAWLIHISGKNFLTESELCDLALSPTEDTLPFVSPGPILPRSQTLHKCPTQPNLPYALAGQMCQLDCKVNFFLPPPTLTLSLHCHRKLLCPTEFPPFPTIMPWCSQLYWTMTSFSSLPTFSCGDALPQKITIIVCCKNCIILPQGVRQLICHSNKSFPALSHTGLC